VVQDTTERIYSGNLFADKRHGIFIVRGENVLLLGEIVRLCCHLSTFTHNTQDLDQEDAIPEPFREASFKEVEDLQKKEAEKRKKKEKSRAALLRRHGFEGEIVDPII
jgi:U6 snRNA-associated Sm-like protein LSm1